MYNEQPFCDVLCTQYLLHIDTHTHTHTHTQSQVSLFQFQEESVLWTEGGLQIFLWGVVRVKGQLKVMQNCSNRCFHLVHSKLLSYAVPEDERKKLPSANIWDCWRLSGTAVHCPGTAAGCVGQAVHCPGTAAGCVGQVCTVLGQL